MGRWFFRMTGDEPKPPAVPQHTSPIVAADRPRASTGTEAPARAGARARDDCHQEKIRELLRLELECAADSSLRKGNPTAARILQRLAKTTRDVEVKVLYAYAQMLDDITSSAASSNGLRQIGSDWFPKTATEYVERLVSDCRDDGSSVRKADK